MAGFDVYTMGFSTRDWEETLAILNTYLIRRLVDIRTLPGSKRTPQFNLEHLEVALPEAAVEYIHLKQLGGLRKPRKDSLVNAGWRNDSFRAYADYMQTPEFQSGITRLEELLREKTSVFVCTEAVFWRCHRQLVSDALLIRGFRVGHIFSKSKVEAHELTKFARVDGYEITYPKAGDPQQGILDQCD